MVPLVPYMSGTSHQPHFLMDSFENVFKKCLSDSEEELLEALLLEQILRPGEKVAGCHHSRATEEWEESGHTHHQTVAPSIAK